MTEQRIILANGSRLLREMLNRILRKTASLNVVLEIPDPQNLPAAIQDNDAEWVITSLPLNDPIPGWIDIYMLEHPSVRIMTVSPDGSQVKLKWLESREDELIDPTLDDLIRILERHPDQVEEVHN
ncbi:MAG: hypothetical protein C3F07_15910 [Anaerolineales bacterium]|nr:hypothetical protein [Anaerolineae bacterium]PWB70759.1 MAG: hypothetical protein C3F07_15910 [Anaerolineales bacterium]